MPRNLAPVQIEQNDDQEIEQNEDQSREGASRSLNIECISRSVVPKNMIISLKIGMKL